MGNWAELPADILVLIAKQLTLFEDFLFFGGVCRSWHSVAIKDNFKGSEQIPWLMLSNNDKPDEQLFISQSKGSVACRVNLPELRGKQRLETLGWLVTIVNGDIDLLHPFTRVQISCPRLITCRDCGMKSMNESIYIHKAVLSSSPKQSEDFDLVVIYGDHGYPAFWRHGNDFWIDVEAVPSFKDGIFYEGIFYGVTNQGMVFGFDVVDRDNWTVKTILDTPDTFNYEFHKQLYLVNSEGVILLVSQDPWMPNSRDDDKGTCRFQVFEATLTEKGEWVEIRSLGDKALFLGDNASVAVDATRFPGIKANCIYYADKYWDTGVYCLEDGSRSHCYEEPSFNPIYPPWPLWVNPPSF